MSTTGHVVLDQVPPQPWRNGGGRTRELLAWPDAEAWQLRVSVADIESDGPFSAFEGVARWFVVLEGGGVRLSLPHGERSLTPADPPLAFEGEAAPMCRLLEGPTRDLNFMARRGDGSATMRVATAGSRLEGDLRFRALYAAGRVLLDIAGRTEALAPGTLLWSDERAAGAWVLRQGGQGGRAWWLSLEGP